MKKIKEASFCSKECEEKSLVELNTQSSYGRGLMIDYALRAIAKGICPNCHRKIK